MARKKGNGRNAGDSTTGPREIATDYRHETAKRKNNPPATLAAEGVVPAIPRAKYSYSPRLPPELRFDPTGKPDALPELLAESTRRKLTADEAKTLADALRTQEPWLEWAGKREAKSFEVDPVALHIHERVSAQAILKVAARQDINHFLFADPEQEYREAVQFYKHNVPWANRMILGDSQMVMSSLARREDLAGKVQMIYIDPPYGISFRSNFQPEVKNTSVGDRERDLTREAEMVKAYRDTWQFGIHSYLSYLRDRLVLSKELLSDSGSIFVQISDENLHLLRDLLDEVFGNRNFIVQFSITKKGSQSGDFVPPVNEYVLWYTRDKAAAITRFRRLYERRDPSDAEGFSLAELPDGEIIPVGEIEKRAINRDICKLLSSNALFSQKPGPNDSVLLRGIQYPSGGNSWKIATSRLPLLDKCDRALFTDNRVRYKRYARDFPAVALSNVWTDLSGATDKRYVVQTNPRIIQRCMLMTTDPGDLVLDPTCGSGTTAYVAEQWGRRWITIDTSRVAISIARQRLLTAKFDYYKLKAPATKAIGGEQLKLDGGRAGTPQGMLPVNDPESPSRGFVYETVPHVTLKSIAQNTNLDPIFAKHEPILDTALSQANNALAKVDAATRAKLEKKLIIKQKNEGKKSITDADRRRWELPQASRRVPTPEDPRQNRAEDGPAQSGKWEHWTIPFDTDEDYPPALADAVKGYRAAWRSKMDEVNKCIANNADQEELVDEPVKLPGVVRVSGPFTVEAVQPPEMSLANPAAVGSAENSLVFDGARGEMQTFEMRPVEVGESAQNIEAYLSQMIRLLKMDGVQFPDNKRKQFTRWSRCISQAMLRGFMPKGAGYRPAKVDPDPNGPNNVVIVFGPQYGPVTAPMVEQLIKPASRRYDDLVIAGFSFDGPAQATIEDAKNPRLRIHIAHIRPDVNPVMNGLLKEQPGSQLFTVFGQPRTSLAGPDTAGQFTITMEGMDIYNPVDNSISVTGSQKVAAWFLDGDYDGRRTFCITQAFFPDKSAWEKLQRALNGPGGVIDADRFEALSGTISLPFPAGKYKCAAVKVIDPRGNEVMKVHRLG